MKNKTAFLLALVLILSFIMPAGALSDIELVSETAVLIDGETGQILYDKNMNQKMFPASITKVMTGMLTLENAKPDEVITMSHDAVFSIGRGTSHIALDEDEQITVEQALYALAIESANDAANGLAEHIGGTTEDFAAMMNERVKECGALNTHFVNAHGLHDEEHYTTAYDMARIAMAAIRTEGFNTYFGAVKYDIPPTNEQEETRYLRSSNQILQGMYDCEGVLMSKNGWTGEAKNTLVTAAERDGTTLIAVVMKSGATEEKFEDTEKLLNWGFANYKPYTVKAEDMAAKAPAAPHIGGEGDKVYIGSFEADDVTILIPKEMSESDISFSFTDIEVNDGQTRADTVCTLLLNGKEIEGIEPVTLSAKLTVQTAAEVQVEEEEQGGKISKWIIVAVCVILAVIVIFAVLYVRALMIQKRRRARRMARRLEQSKYR